MFWLPALCFFPLTRLGDGCPEEPLEGEHRTISCKGVGGGVLCVWRGDYVWSQRNALTSGLGVGACFVWYVHET